MACSTSFLSRQSDVIASFSFGACVHKISELKYILRFIKVILQSVLLNFIIVFKSVYRSF